MPPPTGIRTWTLAAHIEPTVRIGIILDEDACDVVRLRIPSGTYELSAGPPLARLRAGDELEVCWLGALLSARLPSGPPATGLRLRIQPTTTMPLAPGAGVLVHDIVAGRGFHWQKHIDQTLGGTLEFRPGPRGVLLINELPLEDYLAGVITAEMSGACPADLLKAQCVVARSWLLAMTEPKHNDDPFDRCNDDCCQRYQGTGDLSPTALAAVRDCRGEVLLTPGGEVLDANYAKSCGGVSETPVAVWGLEKPGISAIVDAPAGDPAHGFFPVTAENLDAFLDGPWVAQTRCFCSPQVVPVDAIGRYLGRVDTSDDYFRWTVRYARADLETLLRDKLSAAKDLAELLDVRVRARGVSGRAYSVEAEFFDTSKVRVRCRIDSEYRIRQVLHRKFLYSSAFAVRPQRDAGGRLSAVTLRGAGWGHGVGMCQIGALGMALCSHDYRAICRHYYPRAQLTTAY
jgi:stage II sporulation protein D